MNDQKLSERPVIAKDVHGIVVWFNRNRGFGVVLSFESDENIFVHYSNIKCENPEEERPGLCVGELICFDVAIRRTGKEALNVRGPRGRKLLGSGGFIYCRIPQPVHPQGENSETQTGSNSKPAKENATGVSNIAGQTKIDFQRNEGRENWDAHRTRSARQLRTDRQWSGGHQYWGGPQNRDRSQRREGHQWNSGHQHSDGRPLREADQWHRRRGNEHVNRDGYQRQGGHEYWRARQMREGDQLNEREAYQIRGGRGWRIGNLVRGERHPRGGVRHPRGGGRHPRGGEHQSRGGEHQTPGGERESRGEEHQSRGGEHQSRGEEHQSRGGEHQSRGEEHQSRGRERQSRGGDRQSRGGEENSTYRHRTMYCSKNYYPRNGRSYK